MSVVPTMPRIEIPRPGEEVEDGVFVVRRRLLFGGMAAVAAALLTPGLRSQTPQDERTGPATSSRPGTSPASSETTDPATAAYDAFAALTLAEARELLTAATPDEEAYLARIAARLAALGPPPPDRRGKTGAAQPWGFASPVFGPVLAVVQFRLAPGRGFKLHDHRDYNGVLCGVSGDADCRSCEFVDAADSRPTTRRRDRDAESRPAPASDHEFLIRETSRVKLEKGMVSTLSRTRANLHEVMAGKSGADLLDVFTYFKPGAGSHGIKTDWREVQSRKSVYRASWI